MLRLKPWQWAVLALPLVSVVGFIVTAAAAQIYAWGLNWIWGVIVVMLVLWRWLLVRWTQPVLKQVEVALEQAQQELDAVAEAEAAVAPPVGSSAATELETILAAAQQDPPVWEDWNPFWQRCRDVVTAVAHAYHPDVKYPLLNIYLPDAYGLMRGT
ncbi:MAG: GTPase, partial [Nodosilinea sp.]